jgi:hypothetical protein
LLPVYHWASVTGGPKFGRIASFYAGWSVALPNPKVPHLTAIQVERPRMDFRNGFSLSLWRQCYYCLLVSPTRRLRSREMAHLLRLSHNHLGGMRHSHVRPPLLAKNPQLWCFPLHQCLVRHSHGTSNHAVDYWQGLCFEFIRMEGLEQRHWIH